MFPEAVAVIDHVRAEKGIAHFIADKKIRGTLKMTANLKPGQILNVRYKTRQKDGQALYEAVAWTATERLPSPSVYKTVTGEFRIQEGNSFGFIDDVFVAPELVEAHDLSLAGGRSITGKAVCSFNEKKKSWGWKLVEVTS